MASSSERPELRDLVSDLSDVAWDSLKQVLLYLGVPNNKLDDIEITHPTSIGSRRISALDCWLQMDVSASWQKVVDALILFRLMTEAERIAGKHDCRLVLDCQVSNPHVSNPISISTVSIFDKPTLAQLRKLKISGDEELRILDQVAAKWDDIAIAMDFDPDGHTQTAINRDFGSVQEKCRETFKKWLQCQGSRQPATWEILVEILRDCDFENLATSIEAALN